MKVRITLDSKISFLKRKIGKQCLQELKEEFTHENPVFIKNERIGIPNTNEPEMYESFKVKGKRIYFNRGCLKKVKRVLKTYGYKPLVKNRKVSEPVQTYKSNKIKLQKEQVPAVKVGLAKKQGIIRGPCSSGKSVIGLEIIARSKEVGLVVVWNKDHQKQWIQEAQRSDLLNLKKEDIGGVGGVFPKRKFGKLNVCMQQSLWNEEHRDFFFPYCGCLIADEVQRYAANTFNSVINASPAKYRIGLSANERRKDQKQFLIYDAFGKVVHVIPDTDIGSRKKARINLIVTKYENDEYEFTRNSVQLLNDMARDKRRNAVAIKRALKKVKRKKLVLILVERKVQALYLWEKLSKKKLKVMLLVGKTRKTEILENEEWKKSWKEHFLNYNDDNAFFEVKKLGTEKAIDVIIATQKGNVGLNIRTVDHVVITTPTGGNPELFNQQKGRAERDYDEELVKKFGKKKTPSVDYLWDTKIESLRKKGSKILNSFENVHVIQNKE